MKNWKTNLAALIVAGIGIATAMHWITPEVGLSIGTIATSRADGVHPNDYGGKCEGELIAYRLSALNIL